MRTEVLALMQPKGPKKSGPASGLPASIRQTGEPGWATGLRQLYNSVVDEPLPDSFEVLLKKLDDGKKDA